ncbi:glycosyltransferase 87 family protein [Pontibacter populi]|uniref:Glycosyltransferase 87 family protein n=1 Tax=Pontibacter populi TaxID=890055 RepID=A0ABV1RTK2_9BACT
MTSQKRTIAAYVVLGVSAVMYAALGYAMPRDNFAQLVLLFAVCFAGYVYVVNQRVPLWHGIAAAIFFRLILLPATPLLSDDYFRFIWDGRLLSAGINPYLYLPGYFVQEGATIVSGINEALFQRLNSPNYYSVYPPVAQAVFWLSAKLSPYSITGSIVVIRVIILVAEVLNIFLLLRLLRKMGLSDGHVLLYALNPLVILELTGNLHFEALMIFFVLLGLYQLFYQRVVWAGCAFGLAVGVKLLPLLFLPFMWRKLGTRQFFYFLTAVGLTLIVVSFPLINLEVIQHIATSVNLYFQRFEFNASVYYLLRWVGLQLTGYNQIAIIGPLLSLATFAIVVPMAAVKKLGSVRRLAGYMAAALTVFLLLATTVHPWYITTLVALTTLSAFRFAVVWSGLAILSYSAYRTSIYSEDTALIMLEYTIVMLWLLVEVYLYRQRRSHANLK